jgi:uncharacterized protein YlxW (UPF0749 family)
MNVKKVLHIEPSTIGQFFNKVGSYASPNEKIGRFSLAQIYIAIISAIIGILLVTQFRTQAGAFRQLRAQSDEALSQIISDLNHETDVLRRQVAASTVQLYRYNQAAADKKAILAEAAKNLDTLEIAAGLTAVSGPGILVTIEDEEGFLNRHDFLDLIQELKSAGAEAISVNNERIVAHSAFGQRRGDITVNGVSLKAPYEIEAIGDAEILDQAVTILGGAKDTFTAFQGVSLKVTRQEEITIPKAKTKTKFEWAKPAKNT